MRPLAVPVPPPGARSVGEWGGVPLALACCCWRFACCGVQVGCASPSHGFCLSAAALQPLLLKACMARNPFNSCSVTVSGLGLSGCFQVVKVLQLAEQAR